MNLGIDLDGVVYNYHEAVYDYYVGIDKFDGTFNEFWCDWIQSLPKNEQEYIISIPFLYETSSISHNTLYYLNKLRELGDIYYITARSYDLRRVTERWMRKNKLPQDYNLIMSKDKLSYIKLLKIDYFVDDFPSQIESTINFCNSFLYAKVWNKDYQDKLPTVRSLEELYNIIKGELSEVTA